MGKRDCKLCNKTKDYSEFYQRNGGPAGYQCRECLQRRQRVYSMEPERREKRTLKQRQHQRANRGKYLDYQADYYASKNGRVKSLIKSAIRRGLKLGCDIDEEFVLRLMDSERCSVTGITFDYSKPTKTKKNPFAPSLDRIDSNRGYYKDNVRLVIWQYNLMKGEITDNQLYEICKEIVSARSSIQKTI